MDIAFTLPFSEAEVDAEARTCGFCTRRSKLTPWLFVHTLTNGALNTPEGTLNQLAAGLASIMGVSVTAQALDERFTPAAEDLMRHLFAKAMELYAQTRRNTRLRDGLLQSFDHVYIIDSTNFPLHASLKGTFKGSGEGATMRIQMVYDFLSGFVIAEFGDTTLCDAPTLHRLVTNHQLPLDDRCLVIADLGYFKLNTFDAIDQRQGHFLSKMSFGVKLQMPDGQSVNLVDVLRSQPQSLDIIIHHNGHSYRVVACKLPEPLVNQRLRKANRSAVSKKGSTRSQVSDNYRIFCQYAVFITTLPVSFPMPDLYTLYRIRWQIELLFKTWKSVLRIHQLNTTKKHRLMCEVYGKLIIAAWLAHIAAQIEMAFQDRTISLFKLAKQFRALAYPFAMAVYNGQQSYCLFCSSIVESIARSCRKHKQRNKPTIHERLAAFAIPNFDDLLRESLA